MIRAMICDLDGTLVQTEKLKALSSARAATTLRPERNETDVIEAFKDVVGLSRHGVAQTLLARFGLESAAWTHMNSRWVETPWQAYSQIQLKIYNDLLANPEVIGRNQWPHHVELRKCAAETCAKVGLATMSFCFQMQRVLKILKLDNVFDFVASHGDVETGKPDLEIYLLVADPLGVPPSECLVIEDSPTGVEAALSAGVVCIAVSTPLTRQALHATGILDDRWIVDDPDTLLTVVERTMACQTGRKRA